MTDKIAFVTGGGSGICKGITEAFLRHGARAVITSRKLDRLEAAAKEMSAATGRECLAVQADVRYPEQMQAAIKKTIERFGRIDILVCGAAGNFLSPAEKLSPNGFKTVIEIDLLGTFNTIKAAFPYLKESKGCIINISATLQYLGNPHQLHASSAKAGIDALTKSLAVEWGKYGIRTNAIAPGPIEATEGMKKLAFPGYKQLGEAMIPLKRNGTIGDIEHAALFLAADSGLWVNGAILVIDGGAWMGPPLMFYDKDVQKVLLNTIKSQL